jgi:hypothetical protein
MNPLIELTKATEELLRAIGNYNDAVLILNLHSDVDEDEYGYYLNEVKMAQDEVKRCNKNVRSKSLLLEETFKL